MADPLRGNIDPAVIVPHRSEQSPSDLLSINLQRERRAILKVGRALERSTDSTICD